MKDQIFLNVNIKRQQNYYFFSFEVLVIVLICKAHRKDVVLVQKSVVLMPGLHLCSILRSLIVVTDRLSGSDETKVSPVYSAVFGGHEECLELLLKEGYSPDAQPCSVFECRSPLSLIFQKDVQKGYVCSLWCLTAQS